MGHQDYSFPAWLWGVIGFAVVSVLGAGFWLTRPPSPVRQATAVLPTKSAPPITAPMVTQAATMPVRPPPASKPAAPVRQPSAAELLEAERTRAAAAQRENEELKRQLAKIEAERAKAAERQQAATTVSGSAWLARNDGSSDLLRGLNLYLIPTKVPGDILGKNLESKALDAETVAEHEQAEADRNKKYDFMKDIVARHQQSANASRAKAEKIREAIAKTKDGMKTDEAYELVKQASRYGMPYFGSIARGAAIGEAKTDRDGRFSFTSVQAGDYFVYGVIDTPALYVDWLLPVSVSGKPVTIDVENGNASTLQNSRR